MSSVRSIQSIETIRAAYRLASVSPNRTIEPYGVGDYQILVELPGVDQRGPASSGIIQSTAKLEIHAVVGAYGTLTQRRR